jgi:hypothetical protein
MAENKGIEPSADQDWHSFQGCFVPCTLLSIVLGGRLTSRLPYAGAYQVISNHRQRPGWLIFHACIIHYLASFVNSNARGRYLVMSCL